MMIKEILIFTSPFITALPSFSLPLPIYLIRTPQTPKTTIQTTKKN